MVHNANKYINILAHEKVKFVLPYELYSGHMERITCITGKPCLSLQGVEQWFSTFLGHTPRNHLYNPDTPRGDI